MNEQEASDIISNASLPQNSFHYVVLVAEDANKQVLGIALASHFKKPNFFFLDFIATHKQRLSGGIGGALYERLREEAAACHSIGIFFDCLSDEKALSFNEEERKQNIARLKFYERYGARPLAGTKYELKRSDYSIFHLVFDGLGETHRLEGKLCKNIINEILRNKAGKKCTAEYIKEVSRSIKGTIKLRPAKYERGNELKVHTSIHDDQKIALVINEGHIIHHVRERGYLESPVRIKSILRELNKLSFFETLPSKKYPDKIIQEVHDKKYLAFLKKICKKIGNSVTSYGDVFPIRNAARLPKDIELQIGYYCLDTSTPLNANAYKASRAAVDCVLTAADKLKERHMAYALVRPPGHHAERKYFGGFCYFNSSAIAAQHLSKKGKVAILDIDYHHGNGQQDIFL
ncbi:MAG: hypothetical protein HC811_06525 [Flammeovirgaceae bacterium]|nr:hypothetical protein [Flammeovirgaceae bacterium]